MVRIELIINFNRENCAYNKSVDKEIKKVYKKETKVTSYDLWLQFYSK